MKELIRLDPAYKTLRSPGLFVFGMFNTEEIIKNDQRKRHMDEISIDDIIVLFYQISDTYYK